MENIAAYGRFMFWFWTILLFFVFVWIYYRFGYKNRPQEAKVVKPHQMPLESFTYSNGILKFMENGRQCRSTNFFNIIEILDNFCEKELNIHRVPTRHDMTTHGRRKPLNQDFIMMTDEVMLSQDGKRYIILASNEGDVIFYSAYGHQAVIIYQGGHKDFLNYLVSWVKF